MNNEQNHPKLNQRPAYVPTGRLATPKMLDLLEFRLKKKGYHVTRVAQPAK